MSASSSGSSERVVCPASKDTAVRLFIGAGILIGFAIYCFVDAVPKPETMAWNGGDINATLEWILHAYGPWVFTPPGILLIVLAILSLRKKLIADEEGIGYEGRKRYAWDDFTAVDATELKTKDILVLKAGSDDQLVLDGYKLTNFKQLVAYVETHLPAGLFGKPADEQQDEPEAEKKTEANEPAQSE
ncbi:MAG: hypothetical protein ACLFVU_14785 [Phycisphaerae bacterium]